MYDNIPYDKSNPFRGELYHRTGDDSPDVYRKLDVDFKGNTMIIDNFKKLLLGEVTGKVKLNSTMDDNVFIFYSSGGQNGELEFANRLITPSTWKSVLTEMYDRKRFKNMLIYTTAVDSTKAFELLPSDLPVLAIACRNSSDMYCPSESNIVRGKHMNVCLGTEFGVRWNEVTEDVVDEEETIEGHFNRVQSLMNGTTIEYVANQTLKNMPMHEFIGKLLTPTTPVPTTTPTTPTPTTVLPTTVPPTTIPPTPTTPPTLPPFPPTPIPPTPIPPTISPEPGYPTWVIVAMWTTGILLIAVVVVELYLCILRGKSMEDSERRSLVSVVCFTHLSTTLKFETQHNHF